MRYVLIGLSNVEIVLSINDEFLVGGFSFALKVRNITFCIINIEEVVVTQRIAFIPELKSSGFSFGNDVFGHCFRQCQQFCYRRVTFRFCSTGSRICAIAIQVIPYAWNIFLPCSFIKSYSCQERLGGFFTYLAFIGIRNIFFFRKQLYCFL